MAVQFWLQKVAQRTRNVTSLGRERARAVAKFGLDIVALVLTHCLGPSTSPLKRGWSYFHSGVAHGERRRAHVGILIPPGLAPVRCSSPQWTRR